MARAIRARRRARLRLPLLGVALLGLSGLFLLPAVSAGPEPDETVTATEFAARNQMEVTDSGTFVTLKGPLVTVRLYPGTSDVTVQGERFTLKSPIRRNAGDVVIPTRPARFLDRTLAETRGEVLAEREATRLPEIEPLPPAPEPRPRAEREPLADPPRPAVIVPPHDPRWLPKTDDRAWRWIVIHHSDDASGNAAKYDRVHREVNGWDSLGYHFVIGNGSLSADGEVEVGPRWPIQKHGAHARNHELGDNRYNEHGIGICLVGDFDRDGRQPSQRQLAALARLTRWLMARYDIPASMVVRHCDCCRTQCPGRHFPWTRYVQMLGANAPVPAEPAAR